MGKRIQAASASSSSSASVVEASLIVTSRSPGWSASPIATETPLTCVEIKFQAPHAIDWLLSTRPLATPSTDAAQTVSIFIALRTCA